MSLWGVRSPWEDEPAHTPAPRYATVVRALRAVPGRGRGHCRRAVPSAAPPGPPPMRRRAEVMEDVVFGGAGSRSPSSPVRGRRSPAPPGQATAPCPSPLSLGHRLPLSVTPPRPQQGPQGLGKGRWSLIGPWGGRGGVHFRDKATQTDCWMSGRAKETACG